MNLHSIFPDDHSRLKPATSMKDLTNRANVDASDIRKYSAKNWISTTNTLFEQSCYTSPSKLLPLIRDTAADFPFFQAQDSYSKNDLETAYINYLKACTITISIIPKHPDYKDIVIKDKSYIDLRKKTDEYMSVLERIAETLNKVFQARPSVDSAPTRGPEEVSLMTQATSEQHILSNSSNRSAASIAAELPPVPQHQPSAPAPSYIHDRTPANNKKPPPVPSTSTKPSQWKPPSASPNQSMETNLDLTSIAHSTTSASPLPTHSTASVSPLPTKVFIPNTGTKFEKSISVTMSPKQLATYLSQRVDPPSILLIDVRPRDYFTEGHIHGKWIVNIEPLTLKNNITSERLKESLCIATKREQDLFSRRHEFELIVYYDQKSTETSYPPLPDLVNAIYTFEFSNPLGHPPVLLIGGFDAWCKEVEGSRGGVATIKNGESVPILKDYTTIASKSTNGVVVVPKLYTDEMGDVNGMKNEKTNLPEAKRKSPPDVISRSQGRLIHRTLYDYFNNPADEKQSMIQPSITSHSADKRLADTPGVAPPFQPAQPIPDFSRPATASNQEHKRSIQISRRNTYIDNPYLGFTHSNSKMYEPPPAVPTPTSELPAPQKPQPDQIYKESSKILTPTVQSNIDSRHHLPTVNDSFSGIGISFGTTGLKNLGNTCFMNSVIQCLSGTIPLARYFLTGVFRNDLNIENSLGSRGKLANAFDKLLRIMWSEQNTSISPATFRGALIIFAPQFGGSEQQDSQEFLAFLLDGLHEDLNLIKQKPPPPPWLESPEAEENFERMAAEQPWEASALAWERYLMRDSSIIVNLFQGQYKNKMICSFCSKTSTTYDSFMYLSLSIPSGQKEVSLTQCLNNFVKEETLAGQDAWYCPSCNTPRRATKQLTLSRLPTVLLIHLKRFSFKGPFRDKLETMVTYPLRGLDLTPYLPGYVIQQTLTNGGPIVLPEKGTAVPNTNKGVFEYNLYAVSNHFGGLNGGHYTAYVRNGYRNQWQHFDDSRVYVCDNENAIVARSAYTLFYVRNTVQ